MSQPAIRSVKARAIVVPLKRPVKNAFGIIEAAPLVLIDVTTDQGVTGRSYIFAYTKMTLKPLVHLIEEIGRDLTGQAIAPFDLMALMDAKFRLLGWQGLVGMAVSGLDMAFWDALGQAAGKPLVWISTSRSIPPRRRPASRGLHLTTSPGSRSRCRRKICRATPRCARHRRSRFRPVRTGGFRAASLRRSRPARAISSCPIS